MYVNNYTATSLKPQKNLNTVPSQTFMPEKNQALYKYDLPRLTKDNIIYFTPNSANFCGNPFKKYDLKGKTILITGGTGSVAKAVIKDLMKNYSPKKIIIFSRSEDRQHQMRLQGFTDPKFSYVIGDVKDEESLKKNLKGVDVVIHTAAMKHVPICEENPEEAVKTNIDGARNLIRAATEAGVKRVLLTSSDKATAPCNLYGTTKLASEKLFNDANKYTGKKGTKFASVRLGNVLGSNGSIIPVFREQSKTGKLKVTDKRMTRFFMRPEQVSNLITSSIEMMNGGEVFIPKLKATNITNLAHKIGGGRCKIVEAGIRPGEKLHEAFFSSPESFDTIEIKDRFIILPHRDADKSDKLWKGSKKVTPDEGYESNNPAYAMNDKELTKLIKGM